LISEGGGVMPIKGWKVVRLPRCGKIALGRRDEQGLPRAVDYFIAPPEVQAVYEALYKREGRECEYDDEGTLKIRELDVMIPVDDEETFAPYWLKRYGAASLICRGDGEQATVDLAWVDAHPEEYPVAWHDGKPVDVETGDVLEVETGVKGRQWVKLPCPYEKCAHYQRKLCREVFIFSVILPRVNMMGVYSLDSSSWNSFNDLLNSLELLREAERRRGGSGDVSFVPMTLKVHPKKVSFETAGKDGRPRRIQKEVPVLSLALAVSASEFFALKPGGPGVKVEVEPPDEDQKPELLYGPFADEPEGDGSSLSVPAAVSADVGGNGDGGGRSVGSVPVAAVQEQKSEWEREGPAGSASSVKPGPAAPPAVKELRGQYRVLSSGKANGSGGDPYSFVRAESAAGEKVVLYGKGDFLPVVASLREGDLLEAEARVSAGREDALVVAKLALLGSLSRPEDAKKVRVSVTPEGSPLVGRLGGREFVSRACRDWQNDRRVLFALDGGPVDDLAEAEGGCEVRGYAWRDLIEVAQVTPVAGK